jgi:hypothetical protein
MISLKKGLYPMLTKTVLFAAIALVLPNSISAAP